MSRLRAVLAGLAAAAIGTGVLTMATAPAQAAVPAPMDVPETVVINSNNETIPWTAYIPWKSTPTRNESEFCEITLMNTTTSGFVDSTYLERSTAGGLVYGATTPSQRGTLHYWDFQWAAQVGGKFRVTIGGWSCPVEGSDDFEMKF